MQESIVYLSLEYALDEPAPIFSGGLGVLAADFLLEAGKGNRPFFAFGLFYHPKDHRIEENGWKKGQSFTLNLPEKVAVTPWKRRFGEAEITLFATGTELTRMPYGPTRENMIGQQVLLARATREYIEKSKAIDLSKTIFHLNEGHSAMMIMALLCRFTKEGLPRIVATKHTIFHEAGLDLSREEVERIVELFPDLRLAAEEVFAIGSDKKHPTTFSTTKFLLVFGARANAVSEAHRRYELTAHPHSKLITITNGVNPDRWQAENIRGSSNPWHAHEENRVVMIEFVNRETKSRLDRETLTVVWARRLAAYKQPELLLSDLGYLGNLCQNKGGPIQFVIAGQVTAVNPESIIIGDRIKAACQDPRLKGKVVFLPQYSLEIAKILTAGADVWLNTPVVGKEACGTSGMKAGLNGGLLLSTNDGWVAEENWDGLGWILPGESTSSHLYRVLENEVAPLFFQRDNTGVPKAWAERMRRTIELIEEKYTTERMLREYETKLYSSS